MKSKRPVYALLLAGLILAGAGCLSGAGSDTASDGQAQPPNVNQAASPATDSAPNDDTEGTSDAAQPGRYAMSEVAEHDNRDDCWIVVNGDVHDVTGFIPQHPGGPDMTDSCGQDITAYFQGGHPQAGWDKLPDLKIGSLKR